ncbi:MAG: hypothetical protein ACOYT8_05060 [Candidatus Dependentiae bacterium]
MKRLWIVFVIVANSYAMETELEYTPNQIQLITARLRWSGNEDLFKLTKQEENCFINSRIDNEQLAYLDNNAKFITTYFKYNGKTKTVTHTREELKKFLTDRQLLAEVAKCKTTKKNLGRLCTIQ